MIDNLLVEVRDYQNNDIKEENRSLIKYIKNKLPIGAKKLANKEWDRQTNKQSDSHSQINIQKMDSKSAI